MKKNVLAFGAHPDDVEFGCGGTLLLLKELGYYITIIDLTKGEKAKSRAKQRLKEAEKARQILDFERQILDFGDGNISLSEKNKQIIKSLIEKYKPALVFAPYFKDKHPDHENTANLISLSTPTIHYFISDVKNANIGVDISRVHNKKTKAIYAHKSQIRPGDIEWMTKRQKDYGKKLDAKWGELFYTKKKIKLPEIFKSI